jgi:hypothetical protein
MERLPKFEQGKVPNSALTKWPKFRTRLKVAPYSCYSMGLVTKKTIRALRDRFARCEEMSRERERRGIFKCR